MKMYFNWQQYFYKINSCSRIKFNRIVIKFSPVGKRFEFHWTFWTNFPIRLPSELSLVGLTKEAFIS